GPLPVCHDVLLPAAIGMPCVGPMALWPRFPPLLPHSAPAHRTAFLHLQLACSGHPNRILGAAENARARPVPRLLRADRRTLRLPPSTAMQPALRETADPLRSPDCIR